MRDLSVIWRAAGLLMATSADAVVEVLPPVAWRPAHGVPPWVRGLFAYRAQLIPLVNAARLLGTVPEPDRMVNRVLVLRIGTEWPVGMWVDAVLELERIDFAAPGGHPGFATEAARFLGPVAQTRWGQVQLVEARALFSEEQATVLTGRIAEVAT